MAAVPKQVVVLVDPLRAGVKLPQLFNGLGFSCVCVLSTESPTAWWRDSLRRDDFVAVLDEADGLDAVLAGLRRFQPLCVVPGGESGVLLADRISAHFPDLPGNDPALARSRRDKFLMAARLREHGLAAIKGVKVSDMDSAVKFYRGLGAPTAVVKPMASTAADGVRFVDSENAVRAAVTELLGSVDLFGRVNDEVLVQENVAVDGVEYTVNSVSSRGRHHITEVWRMRREMVDATAICVYSELVPPSDAQHTELADYCAAVLDVVGTRNGAAHSEIMLRPGGPVLIETSSRIEGACNPATVRQLLGHSQNSLLPAAYLDPEAFAHDIARPVRPPRHARHVYLLSRYEGPVVNPPVWDRVLALPTLISLDSTLDTATSLTRTTSLAVCPGNLYLADDDERAVAWDYEELRRLEDELYQGMLGSADQGGEPSPATGPPEEVRDAHQLVRGLGQAVHVVADRDVQHTEAERREHRRTTRIHSHVAADDADQRAIDEVAAAGQLLGQVRRRVGFHAVLDVVEDVVGRQQRVRRQIAQ